MDLPTDRLAERLLGGFLGRRVMEATRVFDAEGRPWEVVFYTRPETSSANGICRVDVFTMRFVADFRQAPDATRPVELQSLSLEQRFKAFHPETIEPLDDYEAYIGAWETACAEFDTAADAFRAPSAGDAQWLTKIENQLQAGWADSEGSVVTCDDLADQSCAGAKEMLRGFTIASASSVVDIACSDGFARHYSNCYRVQFAFPEPNSSSTEWTVEISAAIESGVAPVTVQSVHVERHAPPIRHIRPSNTL